MDANTGDIIKELAEGNISPEFEELNIITPGVTWSPDGKRIAISALSHGYDLIYLIDVEEGEFNSISLKLNAINGLSWSWDGKYLAFVGQTARQSDIYIYNFQSKELKNLTNDIFSDSDPEWNHSGSRIYFASDRGGYLTEQSIPENFNIYNHNYKQKDLFSIDVVNGNINKITDYPGSNEFSPVISEDDSEILFISDMSGINNIYKKPILFTSEDENISSIVDTKSVPVTNSQSGIYQLSATKDGKKLVFTSLYKGSYNIFLLNNPFEPEMDVDTLPLTKFKKGLLNLTSPTKIISDESVKKKKDEDQSNITNDSPFFTGNFIDTTNTSEDSLQTDYGNYIFGGENESSDSNKDSVNLAFNPSDNLDENSNYKVNKYKVTFGPDIIFANAGYSTLWLNSY